MWALSIYSSCLVFCLRDNSYPVPPKGGGRWLGRLEPNISGVAGGPNPRISGGSCIIFGGYALHFIKEFITPASRSVYFINELIAANWLSRQTDYRLRHISIIVTISMDKYGYGLGMFWIRSLDIGCGLEIGHIQSISNPIGTVY